MRVTEVIRASFLGQLSADSSRHARPPYDVSFNVDLRLMNHGTHFLISQVRIINRA